MNTTGKILTAAAIGAAVGAVIGILFAPGKGSETRQKLCDKSKEFSNDLKDVVSKGKEKFNSLREEFEETLMGKKEKSA